ncbi:SAM-dependent methyltransferase [Thioalkalivibrio denitrificans]|uniref:SAM-dependent methyltransferase n=1 Tax=Thioalkalivibrio denitrificans TaxID=108003 RepID=A0A1V3NJQ3_9GAMM|nr:class I SAM-dependent methyltransferase [Thioalkalivibrio denitrificans]OOG25173.1 SAM-dependent methyltransferase [Thioalkalivibrio denitrificans]
MSRRTTPLTEALHAYLLEYSLREHPLLKRLRDETAALPQANMQIAPEQAQFMQLLIGLGGARRCLEIGTFTGYSSLAMALSLPADGEVVTCDLSEEWTAMARRFWEAAGVDSRIRLELGPAEDTLNRLVSEGESGRFDFAFIDADKAGYATYYDLCLRLLRPGGLIAVDNTLWGGSVADPSVTDSDTLAIREFNRMLRDDPRIDLSLVPIGDGLSLARKRP